MIQSATRLSRRVYQNYSVISSKPKQKIIIKCKNCDSTAVEVITPNGTILYYCGNKSCNFTGKIQSLFMKPTIQKDIFQYY
jgi:hypothetical protein